MTTITERGTPDMTTQPTNHRTDAEHWIALAKIDHADGDPPLTGVVPALVAIGHYLGALHDVLSALQDDDHDDLDAEEQHQSEKFETTPLEVGDLADDDPTVEQPRYGYGLPPSESQVDDDEVAFHEQRWQGGRVYGPERTQEPQPEETSA